MSIYNLQLKEVNDISAQSFLIILYSNMFGSFVMADYSLGYNTLFICISD